MNHNCTHLIEEVSSVHRLMVDGFCVTKSTFSNGNDCHIKSRCKVDVHDFEIQIQFVPCPYRVAVDRYWVVLVLLYLGTPCDDGVAVHLRCRLQGQSSDLLRLVTTDMPIIFKHPTDRSTQIHLASGKVRDDVQVPGDHLINGGSKFTVKCTIDVRSRRDPNHVSPPPSDLHQHLGKLLENPAGVVVTFVVSGESFPAHKSILAARSPIFMAEFFGNMVERSSQRVEIQDMDPTVFKAMLHFIYTDKVPEIENNNEQQPAEKDEQTVMAQHLLVAADRYGLDRLKAICEERLSHISIGSVASTLALAGQHNFTNLKAKCIDFISGASSKDLQAILETEGYRHLEAGNPSVLTELKATHGKKRKQSMDS